MTQTCNYPGCNQPVPDYRGQGPHPKKCVEHKGMRSPDDKREHDLKAGAKFRAKQRGEAPPVDEEDNLIVLDLINVELGHKRVQLLASPVDDFHPGAVFNADEILSYGNNFISHDVGTPVQPWLEPGMMFAVRGRCQQVSRYWVTPEMRIGGMIYMLPSGRKFITARKTEQSKFTFDMLSENFGFLARPSSPDIDLYAMQSGRIWGMDNEMFTNKFEEGKFFEALEIYKPYMGGCRFVVSPDMVGDCIETMNRWEVYHSRIRDIGYPVAFAAQDGQEKYGLPDGVDAVFIGGSTAWKLGEGARYLIDLAKSRDCWVHIGRVNTLRRIAYSKIVGADSVDGTHFIFKPKAGLEQLRSWMGQQIFNMEGF
jgi:hypothetical protein